MKTHLTSVLLSLLLAIIFSSESFAQNLRDAAPNFSLEKLDGGNFTLSEQEGKVVFIFLFGYGCPHCISNGPNTQTDIYDVYKTHPNFVAVGIDTWNGNASSVQGYKTTTGIEYPILLKGSKVETDYNTTYDRIIVVDPQGIIQYKSTTVADKMTTAVASDIINGLLEQTSSINNQQTNSKLFLLAPNNVENQLIISNPFEHSLHSKLEIIDLTGKVVYTGSIELNNETYIDISTLKPGVFTLILRGVNDYRIAKFVKMQ